MSITMNLFYIGKNGSAKKFVYEMMSSGTVDLIRAEEGNLCYDYFQSLKNPDEVLLIDSWDSQEAIDKHHASSMMKKIIELREKYDLHMEAKRYVSEENNQNDDKFIRK